MRVVSHSPPAVLVVKEKNTKTLPPSPCPAPEGAGELFLLPVQKSSRTQHTGANLPNKPNLNLALRPPTTSQEGRQTEGPVQCPREDESPNARLLENLQDKCSVALAKNCRETLQIDTDVGEIPPLCLVSILTETNKKHTSVMHTGLGNCREHNLGM